MDKKMKQTEPDMGLTVTEAQTPAEVAAVASLMRDMVDWLFVRHHAYRDLVSRYFDPVEFSRELNALPGCFSSPHGMLLIAKVEQQAVGCVGLRRLDHTACEMKRMFVNPRFHGKGAGRALANRLIQGARDLGYDRMRLDTGPKQVEARSLYENLGFREIAPYYEVTCEMEDWLTFMEVDLRKMPMKGENTEN